MQAPHGLGVRKLKSGVQRKAKIAFLSLDELIGWMSEGSYRRFIGIPDGSKVTGVQYDLLTNSLFFAIENESFDEVPHGQPIPRMDLLVQQMNPE